MPDGSRLAWVRSPAPHPRPVRIGPPGPDGARKAHSCRPCMAGAALMPGPTGLDRRPTSIHGVSRGPATLTYHPQRAHAARLAAEKACGHTGVCEKKMLQVGAARWLCSGHRSEGSACLGSYHRGLLTPARSAGLPFTARETGQHWPRRRSLYTNRAPVAGSDDAEGWRAASR
jgi:hypothetical protein